MNSNIEANRSVARLFEGNWNHLFGPGRAETRCRILVDVSNDRLVAAHAFDGAKWLDLSRAEKDDLAQSLFEANAISEAPEQSGLTAVESLPQWAAPQEMPADAQSNELDHARVIEIMKSYGEVVRATQIGFYCSLDALAQKIRGSRQWTMGETFVYAPSDSEFVIMKQVAPASCEMMTFTQNGYHDVLTGYRFGQEELVAQLHSYLEVGTAQQPSGVVEKTGKPAEVAAPKVECYSGYVKVHGARVQVDFEAPVGATSQVRDAAFVAALAQQVDLNYLLIGESVVPAATEPTLPQLSVRDAAQALLNAFGGDTPSSLREEAVALENALAHEVAADKKGSLASGRTPDAFADRLVVSVDQSDGHNVLVAAAPKGMVETEARELVRSCAPSNADYSDLAQDLRERGFVVFGKFATVDID